MSNVKKNDTKDYTTLSGPLPMFPLLADALLINQLVAASVVFGERFLDILISVEGAYTTTKKHQQYTELFSTFI